MRKKFVVLFEISPTVTEGYVPADTLDLLGGLDEVEGAARSVADLTYLSLAEVSPNQAATVGPLSWH